MTRRGRFVVIAASAIGLLAFLWPLFVTEQSGLAHGEDAPWLRVAMLGVLAALGAVLRPLGAGTGGVELVFLPIILGGRAFGPSFGLVLGSVTLFSSALITAGVGPWLPFQMLAASWVGLGAGLLPRSLRGRAEVMALVLYGAFAAFAFGLVMNMYFWPFAVGGGTSISMQAGAPVVENLRRFFAYHVATSLGWDTGRALTNAVVIALMGGNLLGSLRRTARRGSFESETATAQATV